MSDPRYPDRGNGQNPYMRPMQPGQLTQSRTGRRAPVPVGPYTPNEPDSNEAVYAARAEAARRQAQSRPQPRQTRPDDLTAPVQQAMDQAAVQARAARQSGYAQPRQGYPPQGYQTDPRGYRPDERGYQPDGQAYQPQGYRPDAVFYQQATGVQQPRQPQPGPAAAPQPHRMPMAGYAQPPQGGYHQPYSQPDPRLQGYGQQQGYNQPQAAAAAGQHVYMPDPSISRRADDILLADPMLAEEAAQAPTGRRRSRMVMRQERENQENTTLQQKAEAVKQQLRAEEAAAAAADAAGLPVQEEDLPEGITGDAGRSPQAGEAVKTTAAPETPPAAMMAAGDPAAAAPAMAADAMTAADPAADSAMMPAPATFDQPANPSFTPEGPVQLPEIPSMPEIPLSPVFEQAPITGAGAQQANQPAGSAPADLPEIPPQPELADPLAGLNLSAFHQEEEEEPEQEDCMDTSRMPIPAPVSTLDIPKTKRGNRWLALLAAVMVLLAAAGFLWLSGTGEKLVSGATEIFQHITNPTVETGPMNVSPEAAALPAVLTITLTTGEEAADLQLLDDTGHPFEAEITRTLANGGVLWTCRILFDEPYEGFIRANLLVGGQWKLAQASRHVQVN